MSNPSLTASTHSSTGPNRSAAIAGSLLLIVAFLALALATAPQADAANKRIVLGKANNQLKPNCGSNFSRDCIVEGKVTGYQVFRKGSARKRGFVVPFAGKIASWSISLSRPTKRDIESGGETQSAQLPFMNEIFGSPSKARISVLRRVEKNKKGAPKFKMVRQSPVQILNPYFGRTVHFALEKPLNVIRDQVVALTIPTWAPAVWKPRACNVTPGGGELNPGACEDAASDYTWRSSRIPRGDGRNSCQIAIDRQTGDPNEALAKTRPQQKVDSDRRYGCYYGKNVLLYTATVIGKN